MNEKMYVDDNNCDNGNDGDERVFLTPLIIITNNGHQNPLHH